jgi:phage tail sheath protein FI
MSNALLSSKIVITEEPPRISSFTALPTAVLGMVGIAERGPIGTATLVTSFEEWTEVFGGYTLNSRDTIAAVEGFYEEGGQFLWFVRTVRYTDINDVNSAEAIASTGSISTGAATAAPPAILGDLVGPFALVDGDTLVMSVDGGADDTATFNVVNAAITSGNTAPHDFKVQAATTSSNTETFALTDGWTLTISVDGEPAQTATFNTADFGNIALATAQEIADVINTDVNDVLATDVAGAVVITNTRTVVGGRSINVTGGTAAATIGFTPGAVLGYGSGDTITISLDGDPDVTFTINEADYADLNAATAAELIAAFTTQITDITATGDLTLTNNRGGGTSYSIEVTGGTVDSTVLNFAGGAVNGTGDAADSQAVTVSELETLIEADVTGIAVTNVGGAVQLNGVSNGSSFTLQVQTSSTLDTKLGLSNLLAAGTDAATATPTLVPAAKYGGAYGDDVVVRIADAASGVAAEFDVLVLEDGVVVEQFNNLTMDDTALTNFVEDVVNATTSGSHLISLTDQDAALGSPLLDRPANGDYSLSGGDDGLTNIGDTHFIGSAVAKNGLRALDDAGDVTLLSVPARATAAVHNAMITYAEVTRNGSMFALLDPPSGQTAAQMVTYTQTTALLVEASEFAAIYFPRVKVINPNTTLFGNEDSITVPPSGHIAGVMARTDASQPGGIYQPPAGLRNGRLFTITGLEILTGEEVSETFDQTKRDLLYPKRINPLSEVAGGRIIDGVRTLKSTDNFPTIAERRGATFIETTTKANLEPARFRNNDDTLRAEVSRSVESFLLSQMDVGAFRSKDPKKAFSVDFGEGLNPASVQFAGQLVGRIGLATQKPAEFIILKFTQDTRALEQELSQP